MVMAVAIFYQDKRLTIAVGYESGNTLVTQQVDGHGWQILYMSKSHSQPVLSLDLAPSQSFYITSSADAIIAKHPIPTTPRPAMPFPNLQPPSSGESPTAPSSGGSLLSQGLASARPTEGKSPQPRIEIHTSPLKISQTKHAGQQGLKIRSDGRIFATAGWDARVRVYSVQSLKELAVLKWHKEGCYAVAFARILSPEELDRLGRAEHREEADAAAQSNESGPITSRVTMLVKEQRALKAMATHWLAAGSKDGKVSLWDIY
jgi:WD40 repeat protein